MKLAALGASAIAMTLAFSSPSRAMDKVTNDFVVVATATAVLTTQCNYDLTSGSLQKAADKTGVDFDYYSPAIVAAVMAQVDLDYDRNKLIPEVTIVVRNTMNVMADELVRNKSKACRAYGKKFEEAGFVRSK